MRNDYVLIFPGNPYTVQFVHRYSHQLGYTPDDLYCHPNNQNVSEENRNNNYSPDHWL